MGSLPFKDYDFWAYLSSGFLFLLALDYVLGTRLVEREQWTVIQGAIAVSSAYVAGHLVASMSSVLLERFIVGRVLGPPRQALFGNIKIAVLAQWLLPGYYQQLPPSTIALILRKGQALGVTGPGEALFWPAYDVAKNNPVAMDRLRSFLNQYGFCRNVSLVALIDGAMLVGAHIWLGAPADWLWWAAGAVAVGVGMFLRYLKFFRLYAVEVFTTFAYAK